ncbi:MAG: hypothetical protein M3R45_03005 [Pseudomonadota bacterium]|nr:hypothetical protein [Pseudomonadota bacterium]
MTASSTPSSDPQRNVPTGQVSPQAPAESSHDVTPVHEGAGPNGALTSSPSQKPAGQKPTGTEEPELVLEPDLPSDGRDEVGEAMIRNLPQRPELSEPPSQPDPSNT